MSFHTEIAEEISKLQEDAVFIIDSEKVKTYYKFVSYVPEKWNITNILQKSPIDLTIKETEILKQIKVDKENSELFLEYLNSEQKKSKHVYLIQKYFDDNSINYLAKFKLTEEEYAFCVKTTNQFDFLSNEELNVLINELSENCYNNRTIMEEYILYRLNSISTARSIKKLANDIDIRTEENFQMRKKSTIYAQKYYI